MKVLNLYAGIGGNRKLWTDCEVTAVEINPEVASVYAGYFPNDELIVGDAHEYLLRNFDKYDFIWVSPPCQTHSAMARVNFKRYDLRQYFDAKLWQEIVLLKSYAKCKWVVENVKPYYEPLIHPSHKVDRHYFWSNFLISHFEKKNIPNFIDAKFDDIKKWLGYDDFNERIYLKGNHDYTQILRNCVHPETGLHIFNQAKGIYKANNANQTELF